MYTDLHECLITWCTDCCWVATGVGDHEWETGCVEHKSWLQDEGMLASVIGALPDMTIVMTWGMLPLLLWDLVCWSHFVGCPQGSFSENMTKSISLTWLNCIIHVFMQIINLLITCRLFLDRCALVCILCPFSMEEHIVKIIFCFCIMKILELAET